MNLKITKEDHKELLLYKTHQVVIGSHMYGINTSKSDKDILCVYKMPEYWERFKFPNVHQLQYTEGGVDYIWTTAEQFWRNQRSGESTINSDALMWVPYIFTGNTNPELTLKYVRTYKVIKAYLGFAKRDLKKGTRESIFHAARGLFCAECIMNGVLPEVSVIKDLFTVYQHLSLESYMKFKKDLEKEQKEFRVKLQKMYESHELELYYIPETNIPLLDKILQANNIREFQYD